MIAHFITGVLDESLMISGINSLVLTSAFEPNDKVRTLKGSLRGTIMRVLDDGRVVWKPNGSPAELIALPETLLVDEPRRADS